MARNLGGRPQVDPMQRIGWFVRTQVTLSVIYAIQEQMEILDLEKPERGDVPSDFLRLCVYEYFLNHKIFQRHPELIDDASWRSLKKRGLV
jgi:hypothetical protein